MVGLKINGKRDSCVSSMVSLRPLEGKQGPAGPRQSRDRLSPEPTGVKQKWGTLRIYTQEQVQRPPAPACLPERPVPVDHLQAHGGTPWQNLAAAGGPG